MELNPGMPQAEFLERIWQRRPLLLRDAVALPDPAFAPEELADLACEEEVASRIVVEDARSGRWEVRHGPFDAEDFAGLPETHWSLLVQEVDRHVPRMADLLEPFRFVPNWRIDDVMVSYAAAQGSVGPHVDAYDVFLIQLAGRRRWQISPPPAGEAAIRPDSELRILAEFRPSETWVLKPGDALYLPPGVPHHGVAVEPCLTASVGFRAPGVRELLVALLEECVERADDRPVLDACGRLAPDNPGEIAPDVIDRLRAEIRGAIDEGPDFVDWAGRFLTSPRRGAVEEEHAVPSRLAGRSFRRRGPSRLGFVRSGGGHVRLFAAGRSFELHGALADAAERICSREPLTGDRLEPLFAEPGFRELLETLIRLGCLVPDEER